MLILLTTLLPTLRSIFRSRGPRTREVGFASSNRRAAAFCEKTSQVNLRGPPIVSLSVRPLARLALGTRHRQARNSRGLASCQLSPVLDLEGAPRTTGTAGHFPRGPRADPQDVPGEFQ